MQPHALSTTRSHAPFIGAALLLALALLVPAAAEAQCNPCQRMGPPVCTISGGCTTSCIADPSKAGTLCRAGSGDLCDPAEYCTDSGVCPSNDYEPNIGGMRTECRAATGPCDSGPEYCPGTPGDACPAQSGPAPSGTACRAAASACDVAERCNGSSYTCPADAVAAAGTECRAAAGNCDAVEVCSGTSNTCPADAKKEAGTVCREVAGLCDVAETCNGTGNACPANRFVSTGTLCRDKTAACDAAELCSGSSSQCPPNVVAAAGTLCRASAGDCDVAETCDGIFQGCPTDRFVAAGTTCRTSGGVCDVAEACTGSAAACPADGFASSETVCRAASGECDVAETCSGSGSDCPSDGLAPSTTVCRAAAGGCDVAETCSGDAATCPTDAFADASTVCRASGGECDPAESCSGNAAACPADAIAEPETPCSDDDDVCTLDVCDATGTCAHEPTADTDDDGSCDAADPCTNLGGAQDFAAGTKSKLQLTKIGTQTVPNDDGLLLQGVFDLPAGRRFGDLQLDTTGVRLVVSDAAGDLRVDVTLPGGAYAGGRTRGWKRSGKTWTYQDKTGTPENGILKLQVGDKAKSDAPGRVQVKVSGKGGTYPVVAADVPLEAAITLGSQADAVAGLCGESAYVAADCAVKPSGDAIGCKQ